MENRLKVLHVLNSESYSGAENVVITIINNMKEKYDIDFAYASPNGSIKQVLEENNILYFPIDKCEKITNKSIKTVVKQFKPDVIHAHDFRGSIICAFSWLKKPVISHLHNNSPWIKKYGLYSFLYLFSSFKYKKILTVSNSIVNEYVFSSIIKSKLETIGNPIDVNLIRRKSKEKIIKEKYDVIFLGRLSPQKNPIRFINIIVKLKEKVADLKVLMVGDGELRVECERTIEKLGLENNIVMMGFLKNPYPFLLNSKVMCMTSEWEGYGLVVVEAMVLGIHVVAMPVGGIPEILNEGCGKICETDGDFINEIENYLKKENRKMNFTDKDKGLKSSDGLYKNLYMIYEEINDIKKDK